MPLIGSGLIQSADTWPQASDWLIRDEFTDTVAAGSVNGTAATPGPGTRAVVDNDGDALYAGSGALTFANANSIWNDPALWYGLQSRAAGLASIISLSSSSGRFAVGFDTDQSGQTASSQFYGVGNELRAGDAASSIISLSVGSYDYSVSYVYATVLRTTGAMFFKRDSGDWQLLWVSIVGSSNVYPSIGGYQSVHSVDYFRVIALPAPFDTDDGLATDTHSGSVAAGTTFAHEADMLLEFTVTTLPSSGYGLVIFRAQDFTNNYWYLYYEANGSALLVERASGSPTSRGSAGAGAITTGARIVVICDDTSIKIYVNSTLLISYASAANFKTATGGKVATLQNGAVVSDLKTWPRTLSGTAASILNKVSA